MTLVVDPTDWDLWNVKREALIRFPGVPKEAVDVTAIVREEENGDGGPSSDDLDEKKTVAECGLRNDSVLRVRVLTPRKVD